MDIGWPDSHSADGRDLLGRECYAYFCLDLGDEAINLSSHCVPIRYVASTSLLCCESTYFDGIRLGCSPMKVGLHDNQIRPL